MARENMYHAGLVKRSGIFEFMAATRGSGGEMSFTSAFTRAFRGLVEEKAGAPFTTVELLERIRQLAPSLQDKQHLIHSATTNWNRVARIILQPMQKDSSSLISYNAHNTKSVMSLINAEKRMGLRLQFEFSEKPSPQQLQGMAEELKRLFICSDLSIDRIRWISLRETAFARAIAAFRAILEKHRRSRTAPNIEERPAARRETYKRTNFDLAFGELGYPRPSNKALDSPITSQKHSVDDNQVDQIMSQSRSAVDSLIAPQLPTYERRDESEL